MLLLNRRHSDGVSRLNYIQTVACALMMWCPWYERSPAVVHCEEPYEAYLSKVMRAMRSFGSQSSHDHYSNLFLSKPVLVAEMAIAHMCLYGSWRRCKKNYGC